MHIEILDELRYLRLRDFDQSNNDQLFTFVAVASEVY